MKRTLLILLACSSVLLAGCAETKTVKQAYDEAAAGCPTTGFVLVQSQMGRDTTFYCRKQ